MNDAEQDRGGRAAGRKHLSTFAVAEFLQVDPGSVANWIDGGMLKAHRTPGGHRRVAVEDLRRFLHERQMPLPAELDSSPVRIVVVDDEPDMGRLIRRAFADAHPEYEVIEAHDGFRAGAVVATLRPDVVILDLRMPGMDGFEVCRLIKSLEATKHAAVVAVTAHPAPDVEERILACGARMCLKKPVDLAGLIGHVEKALKQVGGEGARERKKRAGVPLRRSRPPTRSHNA